MAGTGRRAPQRSPVCSAITCARSRYSRGPTCWSARRSEANPPSARRASSPSTAARPPRRSGSIPTDIPEYRWQAGALVAAYDPQFELGRRAAFGAAIAAKVSVSRLVALGGLALAVGSADRTAPADPRGDRERARGQGRLARRRGDESVARAARADRRRGVRVPSRPPGSSRQQPACRPRSRRHPRSPRRLPRGRSRDTARTTIPRPSCGRRPSRCGTRPRSSGCGAATAAAPRPRSPRRERSTATGSSSPRSSSPSAMPRRRSPRSPRTRRHIRRRPQKIARLPTSSAGSPRWRSVTGKVRIARRGRRPTEGRYRRGAPADRLARARDRDRREGSSRDPRSR